MTLAELAATLPNGFHDALVHRCSWDLEERTAILEISLWVGDLAERDRSAQERLSRRRLVLEGVSFFHIEPPSRGYPYRAARAVRFDLCEGDRGHPLAGDQPDGVFTARFFVEDWNASIHVAAEDADLLPLAEQGS